MIMILRYIVLAYIVAVLGVVILSWFPLAADGFGQRLFTFLRRMTEPVLGPLRRVLPPVGGVVDLSPTIVLFVLLMVYSLLGSG